MARNAKNQIGESNTNEQFDNQNETMLEVPDYVVETNDQKRSIPLHLRDVHEKITIHLEPSRCINAKILQQKSFIPLYSYRQNKWITGLTQEEALELSEHLGVSLISYSQDEMPAYYNQPIAKLSLSADPVTLDSRNINDYIKIKMIKADSRFAPSKEDLNDPRYAEAMYYIYSSEIEKRSASKIVNLKKQAYDFLDKPFAVKKAVIEVFFDKVYREADEDLINQMFEVAIKEDLKKLIGIMNQDMQEIGMNAFISHAVDSGIVQVSGNKYYYMDELIGKTKNDAITYLLRPDNSNTYQIIKQKTSLQ